MVRAALAAAPPGRVAVQLREKDLDGRELLRFGREGEAPGELLFPYAVAVSKDGWVAVADLGNYRVQRFDREGRYLDGFTPKPAREGTLVQIMDLTVAPAGLLYVVDSKGGRVLACRPESGEVVRTLSAWD